MDKSSGVNRLRMGDSMNSRAGYQRKPADVMGLRGHGTYEVIGPDGKVKQRGKFVNLITQVGDQMYGERGAGVGSLDAPTGMRLGTGNTAPSKTGAGAAIVTYVSGSSKEFDGAPNSSLEGSSRRITYLTTWDPGEATATGIAEAVITNATIADAAGSAANTISRGLLDPVVNKGAEDTFALTWHHDLLGA